MYIDDAGLGKLTKDHLETHELIAKRKAELEQIGESLILLGSNLQNLPQGIRTGEAKIILKGSKGEDRIVLPSQLDICHALRRARELSELLRLEEQLSTKLRGAGMGYIVDGLNNRQAPTEDILAEYR